MSKLPALSFHPLGWAKHALMGGHAVIALSTRERRGKMTIKMHHTNMII